MDGNSAGNSFNGEKSQESKNGIKFLLVEIILIIVLVGFIIGVLNFLGIISISTLLPQPVKNITSNIVIGKSTITIESKVNGYKAELVNKSELTKLLESWQTFDRPYSFGGAGSTGGKSLRNINIHLTDKFDSSKFPWTLYKDKSGKEYLSSNIRLSAGALDIQIFVADSLLNNASQDVSSYVQTSFIGTLYKMTHIPAPGEDPIKREDTITKLLKDLYSNKNIYFRVTKQ